MERRTAARHVWVDSSGSWFDPSPGILLEWQKGRPGRPGWQALVIVVWTYSTGAGSEIRVTQDWYGAEHIRPAEAPRPSRGQRK
ncbi:MAG: hypothetical protein QM638_01325 [Nocardioides sp.]|uniref:hypothetical protein n=1 Tax=Nocardioides sp. TaxID=35761 RepID=UPI0039E5E15D